MDDSVMHEIPDETYNGALAFVLDCGASSLICDDRYKKAEKTIRFDHHTYCEKIADLEVWQTSYESCAGLVTEFAIESGLQLSPRSAKALYTGMVTDSGRFRFDSTTSNTFRLASELLKQSFTINSVYSELFADDFKFIKLRAQFVLKIQFTNYKVAYIYTTKEEFLTYEADAFTISRGMVNTMSEIKGINTWVNFTETDEGVLVEIRSNKYNINPIAVKYGGGGHQCTAGATLTDANDIAKMVADADKMVSDYKATHEGWL